MLQAMKKPKIAYPKDLLAATANANVSTLVWDVRLLERSNVDEMLLAHRRGCSKLS